MCSMEKVLSDGGVVSNITSIELEVSAGAGMSTMEKVLNDGGVVYVSNITSKLETGARMSSMENGLNDGGVVSNITSGLETGAGMSSIEKGLNDGGAVSNVTSKLEVGAGAVMCNMEKVLNDRGAVSTILSKLESATDWYVASMISKGWHDAIIQQASKLALRSLSSLPHVVNSFKLIRVLDMSHVYEEVEDAHLKLCAESFQHLQSLTLGRAFFPNRITNAGILVLAANCRFLEHLKLIYIQGLEDAGMRALSTGCLRLRSLTLGFCFSLTDAAILAICDFPALVELELCGNFWLFTTPGLVKIGTGCPNLLKLRLPHALVGIYQILEAVANGCSKLQEVSTGLQKFNLDPIIMADCRSLTSLTIIFPLTEVLDFIYKVLPICSANKNLKELRFTESLRGMRDIEVREIIHGLKLETLYLAEGIWLSKAALRCIMNCPSLRDLTLGNVKKDYFGGIGQSSASLQRLALRNCHGLKNKELESIISQQRDLQQLDLSLCRRIGFKAFSAIAQCEHLHVLDLRFTHVSDRSLVAIAKGVRTLKELTLTGCNQIRSMEAVASFPTLETLDVEACRFVSDHALEILTSRCPRLLSLDVSGTDVTDEGLFHLCRCSLLRSLRASFCPSVKGPGLVCVAKSCLFFEGVIAGYRLDRATIVELEQQLCDVGLESDSDNDGEVIKSYAYIA